MHRHRPQGSGAKMTRSRNQPSRKMKDKIEARGSEKDATTTRNRKSMHSHTGILRESQQKNRQLRIHRNTSREKDRRTTNPLGRALSTRKSQHEGTRMQRMVHGSQLSGKRCFEAVVDDDDPNVSRLSAMSRERSAPESAGIESNGGFKTKLNPYAPSFVPSTGPISDRGDSSISKCLISSRPPLSPVMQAVPSRRNKGTPDGHEGTTMDQSRQILPRRIEPGVTVIDWQHKIFVADIVSIAECDWIKAIANQHARDAASVNMDSFRKLYTYTECDLPCCEVLALQPLIETILYRVRCLVAKLFQTREASKLVPRTWKEPHILKYTPAGNSDMVMHYDGSHLTWSLMLDQYGIDYSGGGTYFSCLRRTIVVKKGQVLIHPGGLYHKGVGIESGIRTLLICFMDGFDPKVDDDSDYEEESSEYQKNLIIL